VVGRVRPCRTRAGISPCDDDQAAPPGGPKGGLGELTLRPDARRRPGAAGWFFARRPEPHCCNRKPDILVASMAHIGGWYVTRGFFFAHGVVRGRSGRPAGKKGLEVARVGGPGQRRPPPGVRPAGARALGDGGCKPGCPRRGTFGQGCSARPSGGHRATRRR